MSLRTSEVSYGRIVYWSYQAQPHIRRESDINYRYKIRSNYIGWVSPKDKPPSYTGEGSGIRVILQARKEDAWVDHDAPVVLSIHDLDYLDDYLELCKSRRDRTSEGRR